MDNIIDLKNKGLIILAGKMMSGKTNKILDILNNAVKQNIPTMLVSLELSKEEVLNLIKSNDRVYIIDNKFILFIESIVESIRRLKSRLDIKLVLIDELTLLRSNGHYMLGYADINSIMIQQLKVLADELDITIIVTALTDFDRQQFDDNPIGALDFFCKSEKVKGYVDNVILLEKECEENDK